MIRIARAFLNVIVFSKAVIKKDLSNFLSTNDENKRRTKEKKKNYKMERKLPTHWKCRTTSYRMVFEVENGKMNNIICLFHLVISYTIKIVWRSLWNYIHFFLCFFTWQYRRPNYFSFSFVFVHKNLLVSLKTFFVFIFHRKIRFFSLFLIFYFISFCVFFFVCFPFISTFISILCVYDDDRIKWKPSHIEGVWITIAWRLFQIIFSEIQQIYCDCKCAHRIFMFVLLIFLLLLFNLYLQIFLRKNFFS